METEMDLNDRLRILLALPSIVVGFDEGGGEEDLSSLDGLSDEDLEALQELQGLNPDEVKALKDSPKPDEKDQAIDGLRNTLRKERKERRDLQKQLRVLQAKVGDGVKSPEGGKKEGEDGSETDAKHQQEVQRERQKSERLAASFVTNALDTTILRVLGSGAKGVPRFTDTDDVIRLIGRDEIDVDQDPDDPAKVKVDEDDVKTALKTLSKQKPHLLAKEEEGGEGSGGSGSKFGGGRGGSGNAKDRQNQLRDKYPALARR